MWWADDDSAQLGTVNKRDGRTPVVLRNKTSGVVYMKVYDREGQRGEEPTQARTHLFIHFSIPSADIHKCDAMMYYSTYSALHNISDVILVKMSMKLTMVSYILINTQFTMAFPGRNPCQVNNGGCSQLCFPTSENTRSCSCTVGYSLRTDRMSCEGKTASLL